MPAGKTFYQVISGVGSGAWFCTDPAEVALQGVTATGKIVKWSCGGGIIVLHDDLIEPGTAPFVAVGPTWLFDLRCKTVGRVGKFALKIVFTAPTGDRVAVPNDATYDIVGAYSAVIP